MKDITIAAGTQNETKVQAVKTACTNVLINNFSIEPVEVSSGISSNPINHDEAIDGARQRALKSQEITSADFGVGIEGNLFQQSDRWFMTTWVVIIDANSKKEHIAQGIAVEVSEEEVINQIHKDKPLGDVFKTLPASYEYAQYGTPMGYLTGGVFDRTRALTIALEVGFAQLKRDLS